MKNQIIFTTLLCLSTFPAFAKNAPKAPVVAATLQCDQDLSKMTDSTYSERLIVKLTDKNEVISIDDLNWDNKTNKESGSGSAYYDLAKVLAAVPADSKLTYTYSTQDDGDGDYYTSNDLILSLSPSLVGAAVLSNALTNYSPDDLDGTTDDPELIDLNCVLIK